MRLATPQMNEMPANLTKTSVTLSIPWGKVRDDVARQKRDGPKRAKRFEHACEQEFLNRDSLDIVIVINGYLKCLSDVINKRREAQPFRTHTELLEKARALNDMDAVSPDGEKIPLGASQIKLAEIKELLDWNQRLPDLELIQFGRGKPDLGPTPR